ncbi:MAG: hypothetical protein ACK5F7_18355 [Planctomycetaceae bacterium]
MSGALRGCNPSGAPFILKSAACLPSVPHATHPPQPRGSPFLTPRVNSCPQSSCPLFGLFLPLASL